jgi:hypothetical protein
MDETKRRRLLGGLALAAAVMMVAAGETWLQGRLSPAAFLGYWLVCFVLTMVAIVAAFRDVRALARRTRQEQESLVQDALSNIQAEAEARKRRKP